MSLADDSILVVVHRLKQVGELDQEALMFLQLKVKDDLPEVAVLQLLVDLVSVYHLVVQLLPSHLLLSLAHGFRVLTRSERDQVSDSFLKDL